MTEQNAHGRADAHAYADTLTLPATDFPMRSGHAEREPALLDRWNATDLLGRSGALARGRPRLVLHDGPPYANGHLHMGHALNKVLKDFACRSHRMLGYDAPLVPGWDCHGLPVEWKVEQAFREAGRPKDTVPVPEFRAACRDFAGTWVDVQRGEFRRLGVLADWDRPYTTMAPRAEARVAGELLALARDGLLYRGSKPVMWSVAERTALAEAEVEYRDRESDAVHVAFRVRHGAPGGLGGAVVPAWTTTPWTLPANRAVAYGPALPYGAYAHGGRTYLVCDLLADAFREACGLEGLARLRDVGPGVLAALELDHPLAGMDGFGFMVPMLAGDHVTAASGTGFVHTAPSHGREDHDCWTRHAPGLAARGLDAEVPFTMDGDGRLTAACHGFEGRRVLSPSGGPGDADGAVTEALREAGTLLARHPYRHSYPHSWRSRKPVVFRNTPQWFVALDERVHSLGGATLREVASEEVGRTRFVPDVSRNRLGAMLAARPDWLVSRQRSWGVPLAVFVDRATGGLLRDAEVDARVLEAFGAEGADAWFAEGAAARFLGPSRDPDAYEKVDDVLDVWFDSGSTHAFVLDDPEAFPALAGLRRARDGGRDTVVYMEGSDQHRGWFQSSLLESCATRARAPFDVVVTHGFVLDADKVKMSKSGDNAVSPQAMVAADGADVLRLWVALSDPTGDLRVGKVATDAARETYRKLRNTLRWLLGNLAHAEAGATPVPPGELPELERLVLHRLAEVDGQVRSAYLAFDARAALSAVMGFVSGDLSSLYFEARKDALYCDPRSSARRRAAHAVLDATFERLVAWLAPVAPFLAEEAWLARHPAEAGAGGSVHLQDMPATPAAWLDDGLAARWEHVRRVRRAVMGALEERRAAKEMRSGLEAAPVVHVRDPAVMEALRCVDLAELCVTSGAVVVAGEGPAEAYRTPDAGGVAVVVEPARGARCARSWKVLPDVGADPDYPDLSARDAAAVREAMAA